MERRIKVGAAQSTERARGLWMRQGQHRFHATDGHTLIPDSHGSYVRGADDLAQQARARIRGLVAAMPADLDWSAWTLDVHDARGRHVAFVDFDGGGEAHPWEMAS